MLHINIQATKLYFTPETMLVIAFHSYLSVECSLMVLFECFISTTYLF